MFSVMYIRSYICIAVVCSLRITPTSSFVDYIRGGCEINLIVAIDFTVSINVVTLHMQDCMLL